MGIGLFQIVNELGHEFELFEVALRAADPVVGLADLVDGQIEDELRADRMVRNLGKQLEDPLCDHSVHRNVDDAGFDLGTHQTHDLIEVCPNELVASRKSDPHRDAAECRKETSILVDGKVIDFLLPDVARCTSRRT